MGAIEQSLKRALQELGPTLFSSVSVATTLTATLAARLSPWPLSVGTTTTRVSVKLYLLTVMSCVSAYIFYIAFRPMLLQEYWYKSEDKVKVGCDLRLK